MDGAMGRRTVGGLLVTKAGTVLVFREQSPHHKANSCCTRLGCSSKLFLNKDRNMSDSMSAQGVNFRGRSTSRNAASTSETTDNRPRRENAGQDLQAHLERRVNESRNRSLSGGSGPCPLSRNTSITSSLSSSRSTSRSQLRPASRVRNDGERNGGSLRTHRDSTTVNVRRINGGRDHNQLSGFIPRRLSRNRRRQGGPVSSWESLDGSNEYWRFSMNGSDEAEHYYILNDQHRRMRMDIDDMSYEDLLALGERIGTVNTGLSDGALSKCLKRSRYVPTESSSCEDADIKCVICQEEYLPGAEVAKMLCKHHYHTACIQKWLSQKNWCPICRSSVSVASTVSPQYS